MNSGFKFVVVSLILVFALATSQVSIGVPQTRGSTTAKKTSTSKTTTSGSRAAAGSRAASGSRTSTTTTAPTTDGSTTGVISQIQVLKTKGQILLKAPKVGSVTTIGTLFDLINTNNATKTSNFIVFVPGNPPSSKSAGNFGLTLDLLKSNATIRNLQVTIKADDSGIIDLMQKNGSFPKESDVTQAMAYGWGTVFRYTIDNFPKILLYFQLPAITTLPADIQNSIPQDLKNNWQQKFYIIDAWSQTSPIVWNKNLAPEQVCRPYRLLMDWILD